MPKPLPTTIRMYGCLHTLRRERGLSSVAQVRIPEQGRTGRDIARELDLSPEKIEGVFIDHLVYDLDHLIPPGAQVAFVPTGVPGPHRYMLGIYSAGRKNTGGSDQSSETADTPLRNTSPDLDRLTCIDLDQPSLEGFRKFISSWLYQGPAFTFLVDPGPLSTTAHLVGELRRLGVERLDAILLTHIHIDHAGGTGALLREFPEARVICHPEGVRHMVAPEKLWEGSRKVLGELAEAYGEIVPVPAGKIGFQDIVGQTGVRAFPTPGHAQHHLCFLLEDLLFAGEVAGVRSEVPEGIYMRPATPPRFALEVALDSIDRMTALAPRRMVFGHYGLVDNAVEHLQIARRQLLLWVQGVVETASVEEPKREETLFQWLLERDEIYRNIHQLPADIHTRERIFLGNTLRGMSEYVDSLPEQERRTFRQR